jgi:APA family basic amino acid/polyamine antiporter
VILALIYSVWTVYGAGTEALLWGLLLLIAGIPIYAVVRWMKL